MVEYSPAALDSIFQALGDPSRRHILNTLAAGEASISDLARPLRMSLAAVSKHIQTLARAGLIRRAKRGRTHYCQLEPAALAEAHQWLAFYEQFWTSRLDALEAQLRLEDQQPGPGTTPNPQTSERNDA